MLFSLSRIIVDCHLHSKKRSLELLSKLLTEESELDQQIVFTDLLAREKLGSTVICPGVALPHTRIENIQQPMAALLRLYEPINYDDQEEPVQLLIALLLPEHDKQQSLDTLAEVVSLLRNTDLLSQLMSAPNAESLLPLLANSNTNETPTN